MSYLKTKIYLLRYINNHEVAYIGHTRHPLDVRLRNHKSLSLTSTSRLYKTIKMYGGWAFFEIVLLQDYPCNTREEACIEEERCRRNLLSILNSNRCHRTAEDVKQYRVSHYQKHKPVILEQRKQYYKENCETILKWQNQFYANNKETILEKRRQYYANNKEKVRKRTKEYYDRNKERILQRRRDKYNQK